MIAQILAVVIDAESGTLMEIIVSGWSGVRNILEMVAVSFLSCYMSGPLLYV